MKTDTKTWLNIYLEHARHHVHATPQELEVLSHVWRVAWREDWHVVMDYIGQHVPIFRKRFIEPATEMEFVWVPPGVFWMGSSTTEGGRGYDPEAFDDEVPGCEVELTRGYWMGKHPVTRVQYQLFMEATGRDEPEWWIEDRFSYPRMPVVGVSWHDAIAYCGWLTESGELPPGIKATLPTEAQWERAARGTDARKYPWGTEPPDKTLACFNLNWSTGSPAKIGERSKGRSPIRCEDMAGNVWEWCLDNYSGDLSHLLTNNVDPCHVGGNSARVLRGGSWDDEAWFLRCACRYKDQPEYQYRNFGFRVSCAFEHALESLIIEASDFP